MIGQTSYTQQNLLTTTTLIDTTLFYANYGYHPVYMDRTSPEQVADLPQQLQTIHEVQACCQLVMESPSQVQAVCG